MRSPFTGFLAGTAVIACLFATAAEAAIRICPHTGRPFDTETRQWVDGATPITPAPAPAPVRIYVYEDNDDGDTWDEDRFGPRIYRDYNDYLGY